MRWIRHSELEGKHSFLSASKGSWLRYDPEKLLERYSEELAHVRGTKLHALAHQAIDLGIDLENTGQTLNMYVNDCIGYRMKTEQTLYYSQNAFGTADAISFRKDPDSGMFLLRIFDYKSGKTKASPEQLLIYAAYFCLEYKVKPMTIDYDLRIYQNDEIHYIEMDPEDVVYIMSKITEFDKLIERAKDEGVLD
jgi:hypothetical protein